MDFNNTLKRFENELLNSVIPFWENHCVDHQYGGYFTMLDRDGSVYDTGKYMWMQWRIVYMFATLYMEYKVEKWLDIARQGYDFLYRHGRLPDGSYYFQLNRQGEPAMAPFSIFSDCFAAMGAAAMYQATGEEKYKIEAESAMNSYIRRIPNPKGKWEKALPGKGQRLALGSYMILANLGCVMSECLKTTTFDQETDLAVRTVMDKFWNEDLQVLFENVNPDGSFDLDSCEGRFINPGHGLESMWFVLQYAEKQGDRKLIERACRYIDGQFKFGIDKTYGGIFYFMDALGKPHLELQHDMKLWWPHNEALIAALFAYRLSGDRKFLDYFQQIDEWTWAHFPDPEYGEWFGYLNRRGEPTHLLKGGKWKTFFHVPRCLLICKRQLQLLQK
ncbi:AGE family epimerase/isomerase [Victivallis sp. Marseille-Q1083]|uniref:AGE family epimerase/isomerase n=1 Tax=Victivallis sp. Marseille-Q1083 TaxID=2717288 RepID=UPI00158AA159|nr:AGE family epimerase/isomerase [Victivallis sp. Marseille-Q1083]